MKKETKWEASESLSIFGVSPIDPGYIYVIESNNKFKIGRTTNPKKRLQEASTWVPDLVVHGFKPFWSHKNKEKELQIGFSRGWYKNEWFVMPDEGYREELMENFPAFSDTDINANSINFIYWFNGSGLAEFVIEFNRQNKSKKSFIVDESDVRKI